MEIDVGLALFRVFRNDRSAFGYIGLFNDDLTARLLEIADAVSEKGGSKGKLSFLLVEAYQNIIRHRAALPKEIEQGEGRSFFLFRSAAAGHHLVAINPVERSQVESLQRTLDRINGLDKAELKNLFLDRLQADHDGGRGAGLGFIEMARRTGNDLGYLLRGMGPDNALFAFASRLANDTPYTEIIRDAAILHGTVVMNDVLFFHVGMHTVQTTDTFLTMLAHDVDTRSDLVQARVRTYGSVSRTLGEDQGPTRGVSLVKRAGDRLVFVTGRIMSHERARELRDHVLNSTRYADAIHPTGVHEHVEHTVSGSFAELAIRTKEPLRIHTERFEDVTLVLLRAVE